MDLSTTYLGLRLPHPIMAGASPLVDDLGFARRLEDAGAAAIVTHSIFEEQIGRSQPGAHGGFVVGAERYLKHLRRLKAAVAIPVIGSLNGTTPEGWIDYAGQIQDALSLARRPDPATYERDNYLQAVQFWQPRTATSHAAD